jgi:UDP:flavonoid glycosyltransferase YjiC (YdhE family)
MEVGIIANILFINANLYGHINPTLPLVKKLVDHGNQVDYFCSQQFQEKVVAAGASFLIYFDELDTFLASYRPTDRHPFYMLMEYILLYAEVMLPGVLKLI